jgi:uncharacterized protein YndB with AHSA1/START domain
MDTRGDAEATPTKSCSTVERKSERELVVKRTIHGPARIVFEAFSRPDLFKQWWVPKSFGLNLLSCELDVRVGGTYRLVFSHEGSEMAFFGKYVEVIPNARLVWTNDEGDDGGPITTATLEERDGKTLLVIHDLYPSKEALEASGSMGAMDETLDQLDALVGTLGGSSERS